MKAALKDAVQRIKDAGFDHIKVELEGDIGRDGERECYTCEGDGREDCDNCSGSGYVSTYDQNDNEYENECADCYGDGRIECNDCDGSGYDGDYTSEDTCEQIMRDYVRNKDAGALDRLVYGNFYEDGSVDSEFTFTVHIDHVEDVLLWMEAFKDLANQNSGLDVSGAGLHISVLPSTSGGSYPCRGTLPSANIENFKSEVNKLMPALFFLASSGHQSRDMGYRHAGVGEDKYKAISTHDDTSLEYRVFETCYDRPEAFYDYIQVIANTLKFYADPTLKVKELGMKFGFTDGNQVARFFDTPEQLRILNATVKHLKPVDKSFKKLKQERGVHYTIKSLQDKTKVEMARIRADYRTYRQRWHEANNRPLTAEEIREKDWLMAHENLSPTEADAHVRQRYGGGGRLSTLSQFINEQMMRNYDEVIAV